MTNTKAYSCFILLILGVCFAIAADPNDQPRVDKFFAETNCRRMHDMIEAWRLLPLTERMKVLDMLSDRVKDKTWIGFDDTGDFDIPSRVKSGHLKLISPGHGGWTNQDLFIIGGKAAWGIERLFDFKFDFPEINEGLVPAERARRAATIREYLPLYKDVTAFTEETDYPKLKATLAGWAALPPARKAAVAELLGSMYQNTEPVRPVCNNPELRVEPRNPRHDDDGGKKDPFSKQTNQDIYVPAGKAAWAIEELTGQRLLRLNINREIGNPDPNALAEFQASVRFYAVGLRQGVAAPAK